MGLHALLGFRGWKTKPPVNEETEKTAETSPALPEKSCLTVRLLSRFTGGSRRLGSARCLWLCGCRVGVPWAVPARAARVMLQ